MLAHCNLKDSKARSESSGLNTVVSSVKLPQERCRLQASIWKRDRPAAFASRPLGKWRHNRPGRERWCWDDTIHGAGIFNLITHHYWHTVHWYWWFVVGGTVDVGKCAVLAYSWGFLEGAKWLLNVGKYYEYTIYIRELHFFIGT